MARSCAGSNRRHAGEPEPELPVPTLEITPASPDDTTAPTDRHRLCRSQSRRSRTRRPATEATTSETDAVVAPRQPRSDTAARPPSRRPPRSAHRRRPSRPMTTTSRPCGRGSCRAPSSSSSCRRRRRDRDRHGGDHRPDTGCPVRLGLMASFAVAIVVAITARPGAHRASPTPSCSSSDPPAGAQLVVRTGRGDPAVQRVGDIRRRLRPPDRRQRCHRRRGRCSHPPRRRCERVGRRCRPSPDGGYVVAWNIVSADGHPASGAFTFVVGSGVAPDASIVAGASVDGGSESAGVVLKVLRGLGYIGLTLSIGLWAFVLLVDRDAAADRVLRALAAVGGTVVAVIIVGAHPGPGGLHGIGLAHDRRPGHRDGVDRARRYRHRARARAARLGTCRAQRARRRARRPGDRRRGGRRLRRSRCGRSGALVGARRDGGPRGRRVGVGRRARRPRPALVRRVRRSDDGSSRRGSRASPWSPRSWSSPRASCSRSDNSTRGRR